MQEDKDVFGGGGGCLIATATYGTELSHQVQMLREIRDDTLLSTASGTMFMTGFNSTCTIHSHLQLQTMERDNPLFKEMVRAFITPMISTLSIMTLAEDGSESQVVGLGLSVNRIQLGKCILAAPTVAGFCNKQTPQIKKVRWKFLTFFDGFRHC